MLYCIDMLDDTQSYAYQQLEKFPLLRRCQAVLPVCLWLTVMFQGIPPPATVIRRYELGAEMTVDQPRHAE